MLFADLFQIARLIGRVVKAKRFNVQPKVINTFLALRIKEVTRREDEVKAKRKVKEERRKIMSRREKKVFECVISSVAVAIAAPSALLISTAV